MLRKAIWMLMVAVIFACGAAVADELTAIVQKDLVILGYDPGNVSGEISNETIVAISKFQAENDLEVTGEPTPQLAGIIKAKVAQRNRAGGSGATAVAAAPAGGDATALQAAQQACLQSKIEQAQSTQQQKRGFGSLMRAVARSAARFGNADMARDIASVSRDVYDANATAADLESAAKDLGLTQTDLEDCRNPPT